MAFEFIRGNLRPVLNSDHPRRADQNIEGDLVDPAGSIDEVNRSVHVGSHMCRGAERGKIRAVAARNRVVAPDVEGPIARPYWPARSQRDADIDPPAHCATEITFLMPGTLPASGCSA